MIEVEGVFVKWDAHIPHEKLPHLQTFAERLESGEVDMASLCAFTFWREVSAWVTREKSEQSNDHDIVIDIYKAQNTSVLPNPFAPMVTLRYSEKHLHVTTLLSSLIYSSIVRYVTLVAGDVRWSAALHSTPVRVIDLSYNPIPISSRDEIVGAWMQTWKGGTQ